MADAFCSTDGSRDARPAGGRVLDFDMHGAPIVEGDYVRFVGSASGVEGVVFGTSHGVLEVAVPGYGRFGLWPQNAERVRSLRRRLPLRPVRGPQPFDQDVATSTPAGSGRLVRAGDARLRPSSATRPVPAAARPSGRRAGARVRREPLRAEPLHGASGSARSRRAVPLRAVPR